ncbi:MAG: ribonuclease H-like domain-containing protein [Deltaproteobacteria bacterium]|nr:ribonuclease H-like domain-containing protein [Deltaproteobacteria bacterium]
MLERTFIHIPGIGPKTEQTLWSRGIHRWRDFLDHPKPVFSPARDRSIGSELEASLAHRNDIGFFNDRLPPGDMWRIFNAFRQRAVYLDIETSGYDQWTNDITVIGIYDGNRVQTFVNGKNLEAFEVAIADYDLVITFNGACFDLPFIRRYFPGISLPQGHIDLRFVLKKLGLEGGLKKIEKDVGIARGGDIDGVGGFEAVRLWQRYQWGDEESLSKLISYNSADIVNLEPLMEMVYHEMKSRIFHNCQRR